MPETTQAPEATETDETTPEVPEATPDEAQEPDDHGTGREAARYRRQLRDAESERDGLRGQLAEIRRQVAEEHSGLAKPGALWAAEVDLESLFSEDGRLDHERLIQAVGDASERLGLTRAPRSPVPDPNQGRGGADSVRDGWAEAFKS